MAQFEIVGEAGIDEVGAVKRALARVTKPISFPMAMAVETAPQPSPVVSTIGAPQGVSVMPSQVLTIMRRMLAPVPSTAIGAGLTADIVFRPQRRMRIERLVLNSSVTPPTATINEIRIGARSMYANAGAVPIGVFGNTSTDTVLRGYTCDPGMDVTLTVNVPGLAAETITGCIIGETLDD